MQEGTKGQKIFKDDELENKQKLQKKKKREKAAKKEDEKMPDSAIKQSSMSPESLKGESSAQSKKSLKTQELGTPNVASLMPLGETAMDSEDETIEDYKVGGYHPVHVGEIMLCRYIVLQKLGWGHFSTVWLAKDMKYNTFVAIKIQKSAPHYLEAAYDEVEILEQVSSYWKKDEWMKSAREYLHLPPEQSPGMDSCFSVQLLNSFLHFGSNGKHFVMVFEIMGVYLLDIIRRYEYRGIPIPLVRIMARHVLIGLDYLHRICKIIHTDLKPENVLLCLTREQIHEIRTTGQLGKKTNYRFPVYLCGQEEDSTSRPENKEIVSEQDQSLSEQIDMSQSKPEEKKKRRKRVKKKQNKEEEKKEKTSELTEEELLRKERKRQKKKRLKKKKRERERQQQDQAPKVDDSAMATTNVSFYPSKETKEEIKREELKTANIEEEKQSNEPPAELPPEEGLLKPRSRSIPNMEADPETGSYFLAGEIDDFTAELEEYLLHKVVYEKQKVASPLIEKTPSPEAESLPKTPKSLPKVKNPITEDVRAKIVDLGNGCWTYHHFSSQIQTRQYRSPEVILGCGYGTSADIWSFACMIFELITGEFLFEPRKSKSFSKDDDHLAQMIELLGEMPKNLAISGKNFSKFFGKNMTLKRIQGFHYWPLKKLLIEKYEIRENEAEALTEFLLPMLEWYPERRATAQQMLEHPWLSMPADYNYKLSKREAQKHSLQMGIKGSSIPEREDIGILAESDTELHLADYEDNDNLSFDSKDEEEEVESDPKAKKYSLESELLNNDHGPNPQFKSFMKHRLP